MQVFILVYQNDFFKSREYLWALLVTYMGSDNNGVKPIKISVALSRQLNVLPGQYISLRMSAVSWWSWTQSHAFMATPLSQRKQRTLELFVQPRRGLTADLLRHVHAGSGVSFSFPTFISGPHGVTEPVGRYETVVMMMKGFGVAAVIPHLKQLIYGYNPNTLYSQYVYTRPFNRILRKKIHINLLYNSEGMGFSVLVKIFAWAVDIRLVVLQHKADCFFSYYLKFSYPFKLAAVVRRVSGIRL